MYRTENCLEQYLFTALKPTVAALKFFEVSNGK